MNLLIALVLGMTLAVMLLISIAEASQYPVCYEDEVIVWTGDAHTKCVPLDDLTRERK